MREIGDDGAAALDGLDVVVEFALGDFEIADAIGERLVVKELVHAGVTAGDSRNAGAAVGGEQIGSCDAVGDALRRVVGADRLQTICR